MDDENLTVPAKSYHQQRVEAFMKKAKQDVPNTPTIPSEAVRILRAKLIWEEVMELINDGLGVRPVPVAGGSKPGEVEFECFKPADIVLVADGCADISVVNTGCLSAFGISDMSILDEVDENNLAKFGEGHSWREDGKLIKPPNHQTPNFKKVLKEQGLND